MPLTFPAHQAPVVPLKLWRPRWFDGTALCVGAAAPDLGYPFDVWTGALSHTWLGVALWAVPVTVAVCAVLRWRAAAGVFAHLPDAGPLRLRSYRVLARRRPAVAVTVLSAALGGLSHVAIDAFTHPSRWGAEWLGLDAVVGELPLRGAFTAARVLQYVGHVGGSALGLALLAYLGRRRLLEAWYGADEVRAARAVATTPTQRWAFWGLVLGPTALAATWFTVADHTAVFATIAALTVSLLTAGSLPLHDEVRPREPSPDHPPPAGREPARR